MKIPFSFTRMFLEPGRTFAVPTVAGARLRVVDGSVWATTSGSPDDVWLSAGDEHTVGKPGLTVIESVARSTVEFIPRSASEARDWTGARFESVLARAACKLGAAAMTAITVVLLVILPAQVASHSEAKPQVASNVTRMPPIEVVGRRPADIVTPPAKPIASTASGDRRSLIGGGQPRS